MSDTPLPVSRSDVRRSSTHAVCACGRYLSSRTTFHVSLFTISVSSPNAGAAAPSLTNCHTITVPSARTSRRPETSPNPLPRRASEDDYRRLRWPGTLLDMKASGRETGKDTKRRKRWRMGLQTIGREADGVDGLLVASEVGQELHLHVPVHCSRNLPNLQESIFLSFICSVIARE